MAFVTRVWNDRISEYPNRRTINDGVTTKVVTVGRDEGNITIQGDAFNSTNMNDLESRIADAFGDTPIYTAGENIDLTGNVISVTDFMTVQEAHDLWSNA